MGALHRPAPRLHPWIMWRPRFTPAPDMRRGVGRDDQLLSQSVVVRRIHAQAGPLHPWWGDRDPCVQQLGQGGVIIHVGRGDDGGYRHPAPFGQHLAFAAVFAPIGRVGSDRRRRGARFGGSGAFTRQPSAACRPTGCPALGRTAAGTPPTDVATPRSSPTAESGHAPWLPSQTRLAGLATGSPSATHTAPRPVPGGCPSTAARLWGAPPAAGSARRWSTTRLALARLSAAPLALPRVCSSSTSGKVYRNAGGLSDRFLAAQPTRSSRQHPSCVGQIGRASCRERAMNE